MKYSVDNPPLVCMMTQSTCYRNTTRMTPLGVLWHSTGAKNPNLCRYVQPDDDAKDRDEMIKILGKNQYGNDWNHVERWAGLNCWIGKLADGTVSTVQTLPWDFKPWGCGSGDKGTCNTCWIQFEICEDDLTDPYYFNEAYKEACEVTAYLCKMFCIDPKGYVNFKGISVPTILCHQDSYKYGLGCNHSDIYNWFPKYGKNMETVRNDVKELMDKSTPYSPPSAQINENDLVKISSDAVYYSGKNVPSWVTKLNWYVSEVSGDRAVINKSEDGNHSIMSPISTKYLTVVKSSSQNTTPTEEMYRVRISWSDSKSQKGAYKDLEKAKSCSQDYAKEGYKVFDSRGNVVFTPEIPEDPSEIVSPSKPQKEVRPEYNNPTEIVGYSNSESTETRVKVYKKIKSVCSNFDKAIVESFFNASSYYKINPLIAISQSILETGWFRFKESSVKPDQHNYCGLGVTSTGEEGASFDSVDDGVHAQYQHLYAYGCTDDLPPEVKLIDPRFSLVTRGSAKYWEDLAGTWAVPGYDQRMYLSLSDAASKSETYGQKCIKIANNILDVEVTKEEINEYYEYDQNDSTVNTDNSDDSTENQENSNTPQDGEYEDSENYDETGLETDATNPNKDLSGISDAEFGSIVKKFITILVEFIKSLFNKK